MAALAAQLGKEEGEVLAVGDFSRVPMQVPETTGQRERMVPGEEMVQ